MSGAWTIRSAATRRQTRSSTRSTSCAIQHRRIAASSCSRSWGAAPAGSLSSRASRAVRSTSSSLRRNLISRRSSTLHPHRRRRGRGKGAGRLRLHRKTYGHRDARLGTRPHPARRFTDGHRPRTRQPARRAGGARTHLGALGHRVRLPQGTRRLRQPLRRCQQQESARSRVPAPRKGAFLEHPPQHP